MRWYISIPILILLLVIIVVVATFDFSVEVPKTLIIGGVEIDLLVAESTSERSAGLSNRESLHETSGMLFIFPEEGNYGFWMKDMKFSIDIIWINEAGKIVYIEEDVSPKTYPEVFNSTDSALYVLELNSGYVGKNGVKVGDLLSL